MLGRNETKIMLGRQTLRVFDGKRTDPRITVFLSQPSLYCSGHNVTKNEFFLMTWV
jgi:hypothetical protein